MVRVNYILASFIFVLLCSVAPLEARKLTSLEKEFDHQLIPSSKNSFQLSVFGGGITSTPTSSDIYGHAMAKTNDHRILVESVPSPGIGH